MTPTRCGWVNDDPLYIAYHDEEWGVPVRDDRKLFEMLILEGAQAGLSWYTILKKREAYARAFDGFDPERIARYDETKIASLLEDSGIVRNRLKVHAAIGNARAWLDLRTSGTGFSEFLWELAGGAPVVNAWRRLEDVPASTPVSEAMSKALKRRGFRFVGPTNLLRVHAGGGNGERSRHLVFPPRGVHDDFPSTGPPMIDADLRRAYETDGVVCLRQAFDAGWLEVASDAIEQGRANPGPMYIDYSAETTPGTYYGDFWTWPQVPAMRTFIFDSPAARLVGEVMGVAFVWSPHDQGLRRFRSQHLRAVLSQEHGVGDEVVHDIRVREPGVGVEGHADLQLQLRPRRQSDHPRPAGPARRKPDGDDVAAVVAVIVGETRRRPPPRATRRRRHRPAPPA